MSKAIVICGLSGSGKTTLAKELSRRLGIVCLHKDSVKERLYELMEGSMLEDSKRTGFYAIRLILALAEEQIANGVDVIVESPFNHEDNAKLFHAWKEKYPIDFYAIVCQADREELVRRRFNRPRHHSHHESERLKSSEALYAEAWDYSAMPEKKIFVTTDRPAERLVEDVLGHLAR
jgi:predicted kinase